MILLIRQRKKPMPFTTPDDLKKLFHETYKKEADAIFRHCFFRVFDREIARELTQDTFMKTWDYLAHRGHIDYLRAFLYKTATHVIIDYIRKKKHRGHASLEQLQEQGFEPVESTKQEVGTDILTEARIVLEAIEQLKPTYKEPLLLRYLHGWAPKEIAKHLHLSENVISVRLYRGLKQLQKTLL